MALSHNAFRAKAYIIQTAGGDFVEVFMCFTEAEATARYKEAERAYYIEWEDAYQEGKTFESWNEDGPHLYMEQVPITMVKK